MKTVLRENTWLKSNTQIIDDLAMFDHGWGNGYIVIPKGHELYMMGYDEIHDTYDISVHGGLTYSELVTREKKVLFGLEDNDINSWIIGFDTCHCDDTSALDKQWVQDETDSLLEQCNNLVEHDDEDY